MQSAQKWCKEKTCSEYRFRLVCEEIFACTSLVFQSFGLGKTSWRRASSGYVLTTFEGFIYWVGCRQRKEYKETWWWNEEVKQSIQRKKLPKKKLDRQMKKVDMSTGKFGIPHREMLIRSCMWGGILRKKERTCIRWVAKETELEQTCKRFH